MDDLIPVPEQGPALLATEALGQRVSFGRDSMAPSLLVLHGPPGTGKSFLVRRLLDQVTVPGASHPATGLLVSAREEFGVSPSGKRGDEGFVGAGSIRQRQTCDLLVVEDIQFLPSAGVAAFLRLLDERESHGLATVITGSTGPRHLQTQGQPASTRLTSRLAAGLVIGIVPLGAESRRVVVTELVRRRSLSLLEEIVAWVAENISGFRSLAGALGQIELLAKLHKSLKKSLVLDHLQKQIDAQRPTVERIAGRVADYFQVPPKDLRSKNRQRGIVVPRHVSMYLARRLTPLSFHQIGAFFGGCDHTTVLHACRKMEETLKADAVLDGTVKRLHEEFL